MRGKAYFSHARSIVDAGAEVGAGAVISRDIPDHALAYGCPAEIHGYACCCELSFQAGKATCEDCGSRYALISNIVVPED